MTQILSTLAEFDAVVQGYQQDSRAVAASLANHLKMSNSNTAKCCSAVETLATRYATIASRTDAWDQRYTTPTEHVTVVPTPPSAPPPVSDPELMGPMASTIRTFVQSRGGRRGGGSTTNTDITENPLCGRELPKNRRNLVSLRGGRLLRARSTPQSLPPRGPVRWRTPLHWRTSIPSRKMLSLPPGNLRTRLLILWTGVQFLQ